MPGKRVLPDLIVMALALWAGRSLLKGVSQPIRRWVTGFAVILWAAGFLVVMLQGAEREAGFRWMMLGGTVFALSACLILMVAIRTGLRAVPVEPNRRRLLTTAAMAAPVAALGYGTFIGRRQFRLKEVEVPVPNLAADLDGLRIAQLSDIHLSPFLSRADLQWCVAMANETRPHLAAVTGDLITGIRDSIDDCLEDLRHLHTDAGIFGCNGNHERYIGAEAYTVDRAARLGMKFLRAERTTLRFGSAVVNLAGLDHFTDDPIYEKESQGLWQPGEFNLLLNHNPAAFASIAKQDWDLTLAGHMHGGQINIELANSQFNALRFTSPYTYGLYRQRRSVMYVTRGIGTIGMPLRIGAPPEVALIRLRRVPEVL